MGMTGWVVLLVATIAATKELDRQNKKLEKDCAELKRKYGVK